MRTRREVKAERKRKERETASDPEVKWNKATRLAVAAHVSPHLRNNPAKLRRVARIDADGNVVGYTTLGEVQKALLERQRIELETVEGVRPKAIVCEYCGRVQNDPAPRQKFCTPCTHTECSDCGVTIKRTTNQIRRRHVEKPRCLSCAKRARQEASPRVVCTDCGSELHRGAHRHNTQRCWSCTARSRRGANHPLAKIARLTEEQIADIRWRNQAGESWRSIAKSIGVDRVALRRYFGNEDLHTNRDLYGTIIARISTTHPSPRVLLASPLPLGSPPGPC